MDPLDLPIQYALSSSIWEWDDFGEKKSTTLRKLEPMLLKLINEGKPPLGFMLLHEHAGVVQCCLVPPAQRDQGLFGEPGEEPWTHQNATRHACGQMEQFIRGWWGAGSPK